MSDYSVSRTVPFRQLLSRIGYSSYRLNTILVGLEEIAAGKGESGTVGVTWKKPKDLNTARETADQARIFASSGSLVFAADVFDSFIRDLPKQRWLKFSEETRRIMNKDETSSETGEYSVDERLDACCKELNIDEPVRVSALTLLMLWRNAVVHSGSKKSRLKARLRTELLDAAKFFYEKHSHLDISLALKNFDSRNAPVPKETSSLIACSVNLCRFLDEQSIKRVAATSDGIMSSVEMMLQDYFTASDERLATPWTELSEAWQGTTDRRYRKLSKILQQVGVTKNNTPTSAELPKRYIQELCELSRDEFAQRFNILK